jgi:hypothetical protein
MTVNEKAEALVEMGLVVLTEYDANYRPTAAKVSARNLDVATVRFERRGKVIVVCSCVHKRQDGSEHVCEGHQFGHVCYHARAALMMGAKVAGKTLVFGNEGVRVVVNGHEGKAVHATVKGG